MQNRYRFTPDTDIRQTEVLPAIPQLKMNRNAMMASFRWYDSLEDKTAEPQTHDRLIAIIAVAGWAAEGLRTVERNSGVFRRELLSQDESRQTWDDCFKQELPRVKVLQQVRNKYFAHWDPKIARNVVERVARGEIEPVFMEWNEKQNLDSLCTMAHLAVATDLFGIASRDDELKRASSARWSTTFAPGGDCCTPLETLNSVSTKRGEPQTACIARRRPRTTCESRWRGRSFRSRRL